MLSAVREEVRGLREPRGGFDLHRDGGSQGKVWQGICLGHGAEGLLCKGVHAWERELALPRNLLGRSQK